MHIKIRWKILYHKHGEGDTKKCSSEEEVGGRGAIKKTSKRAPIVIKVATIITSMLDPHPVWGFKACFQFNWADC